MRNFLIFIAIITALFLWQRHHAANTVTTADEPAKPKIVSTAQPTRAPLGQASEHNWMKRSLDRATEVRNQARNQTRDAQNP